MIDLHELDDQGDPIPGSLKPIAVCVLRMLEDARGRELSVKTIAKHLRAEHENAHALLNTMREMGLVVRGAGWLRRGSARYRLAVHLAVRRDARMWGGRS